MGEVDVLVGVVGRARGLAGEVYVDLRTDEPLRRFATGARLRTGDARTLTVAGFVRQGVRGLVRFDGVDDRTAAEALTGAELWASVDATETTGVPDEFFDHQLVGLTVVTPDGNVRGQVARVEHLGFQDTLVVATPGGERPVPFVNDLVPEVDLVAGRVVVRPIPGLLEDEQA